VRASSVCRLFRSLNCDVILAGFEPHRAALQRLQSLHLAQKESLAATNPRVDGLVSGYNDSVGGVVDIPARLDGSPDMACSSQVDALSQLFLHWDQVLTRLEAQVVRSQHERAN
jgi:hypothetical protein